MTTFYITHIYRNLYILTYAWNGKWEKIYILKQSTEFNRLEFNGE